MIIPEFPDYVFIDDNSIRMEIQNNVFRSEMEVGPNKTRPIACKPMTQVSFTGSICGLLDFNSFQAWFKNEVSFGSSWFLLIDPFDGIEKRFRFVETNLSWAKSEEIYSTSFSLEYMNE